MVLGGPTMRQVARGVGRRIRRLADPPVPASAYRLVPDPVFVLSSVRSGSTLLRVLLNSHPKIRAPHEMHLRTLSVNLTKPYTTKAMAELRLDQRELEYLLWDRILHRELVRSGKKIIVDKTPGNAGVWERLHEGWPQARYLFLRMYVDEVEAARNNLDGLPVRYEELTEKSEQVTQEICTYVGVEWTAKMLNYRRGDHGPFVPFIGDWSDNIKSGKIQKARPLPGPDDVPPALREVTRAWGYPC